MKILMIIPFFFGMFGITQAMELSAKNLGQIKLACTDPSAVQNQEPPAEIKLTCSELITSWLASMQGVLMLPKSDLMETSATTDKPNVGSESEITVLPLANYPADCPRYNEVKLSASMVYDLTCEEVKEITNLGEYCKNRFDQELANNPAFYTIVPTGKIRDTCNGLDPIIPGRRAVSSQRSL